MNRAALTMASLCTLAVASISTAVTFFGGLVTTGQLEVPRLIGAGACLGTGLLLIYVGHCRAMLPGVGK